MKVSIPSLSLVARLYDYPRLPKRAGEIDVIVNGAPVSLLVTNNRAFTGATEPTIAYAYIEHEGKIGYFAFPFTADLTDAEITIEKGDAPARPKPIAATPAAREANERRIAGFKTAIAAKNISIEAMLNPTE